MPARQPKVFALKPPRALWYAYMDVAGEVIVDPELEPSAGMEPFRLAAYQPVEVPDPTYVVPAPIVAVRTGAAESTGSFLVTSTPVVTGGGDLIEERLTAEELLTGATVRWTSAVESLTGTSWASVQGSETLTASLDPIVDSDYEYVVESDLYSFSAVNTGGVDKTYLSTGFTGAMGTAASYSVAMVFFLGDLTNEALGDEDGLYGGLIFPQTDEAGTPALQQRGSVLQFRAGSAQSWTSLPGFYTNTSNPIYLVWSVGALLQISVGFGPSTMRSYAMPYTGTPETALFLGRTTVDPDHTADVKILDLGFYDRALSAEEMKREVSVLTGVYGGQ